VGENATQAPVEEFQKIYVVNHGWFTGIVMASAQSAEALGWSFDEPHNFPWIEVAWGDRKFYLADKPGWFSALRASLFSKGPVLHVAGFAEDPKKFFEAYQVVEVTVDRAGFDNLLRGIVETVATDQDGVRLEVVEPSLYGIGHMYAATGKFSLLSTWNTWTARMLARAGCSHIQPNSTRASVLMAQLLRQRDDSAAHDRVNAIRADGMDAVLVP